MASIPFDVIRNILFSLAVRDLLRFRCVSKFLRSFIDSPDFIKQHLSYPKKPNINLYGINKVVQFKHPQFKMIDLSIDYANNISGFMVNRPPDIEPAHLWKVVGSCNGLIALNNEKGSTNITMLWNPFTGKSKKVASWIRYHSKTTIGFGYDSKTDDYKLVRISEYWSYGLECEVYSLKANSWRKIVKDWSFMRRFGTSWMEEDGVFVNNALHWLIQDEDDDYDRKMFAFDLVNEDYLYIPILECIHYKSMKLSVLDGCLILTGYYKKYIEVWIMKEYGVNGSWTIIIYYIDVEWPPRTLVRLAYSRGRDKIMSENSSSCFDGSGALFIVGQVQTFTASFIALDDTISAIDPFEEERILSHDKNAEEKSFVIPESGRTKRKRSTIEDLDM